MGSLVSSGLATQGYIILIGYMVAMLGIGIYCNRRFTNDLSGYLMGGRSLGPWIFALTYGSTFLSSSTFIGNTSAAYKGGLAYLMMPFLQMALLPIGLLMFSHGLRKQSARLNAMTIPEFLSKRYQSSAMGFLSSLTIVVFMVPYMVGIVKGGAVSLQQLLGVSYVVGVLLVAGVALVYLMAGGYMARCYTDVIQGLMMGFGMLLVAVVGFYVVGGPTEIAHKLGALDPNLLETPGPMGWSNLIVFSTVFAIAPWGLPQLVQTNFTIKHRRVVYTSAIVLTVWITAMLFGSMIIGNIGRAYFGDQFLESSDVVFPTMVLTFFPNFIGSFIICAVIAAAMSTIDGVLMTSGSAVGVDIYKKYINRDASERSVLVATNVAMFAIVVVVVVWAFYPPKMLLYFTSYAFSTTACGMIIPIFMGIFNKHGTGAAAVASFLTGVGATIFWYVYQPGGKFILGLPPFIAGVVLSAAVFMIVSRMSEALPRDFVEDLFSREADLAAYED